MIEGYEPFKETTESLLKVEFARQKAERDIANSHPLDEMLGGKWSTAPRGGYEEMVNGVPVSFLHFENFLRLVEKTFGQSFEEIFESMTAPQQRVTYTLLRMGLNTLK